MFRYALAAAFALTALSVASNAHAHIPEVFGHTACEDGAPVVGWDVVSGDLSADWTHPAVYVQASFDGGPWFDVQLGEIASPGFGFSGSLEVTGVAQVRIRTYADGPWSDGYWWEGPFYADGGSPDEADATEFAVPTDCAPPPPSNPGTGTPGYWRNHPEAWPVDALDLGGFTYTRAEAIEVLSSPARGDKTITMARAVIAAELNLLIGNDGTCIAAELSAAQEWLADNPIGSRVRGSSAAWAAGEPLATTLDDYNNGRLCAPHRD